ncbi:hypothetical protein RclHR1_09640001 [Rhizophagus clarus]|uniref:Restriction endonuclease domain-containing protein n=1 Tax=Rhizophagus clarus TaxID=94130 RepID=A0A2Z6SI18_9GLOM|nr:hypothetical protein RclHR1_09640001 [Rhizophagus clarus]GES90110.1 hypothetical protein GLOIN_2v1768213 [Rhizophagus clarus]
MTSISTGLTASTSLSQRTSTSSKFKLSQKLLESARARLLEQETQVTLAENVSIENFIDYIENEQDLPVKIRLVDKKVIAYEVVLTPHGVVTGYVIALAYANQLVGASEENLIVGPNSYFTADATIRPRRVPPPPLAQACNSSGYAYPTMVIEVGLGQSIRNLHELTPIYFSRRTTIMIFLLIKIYPVRQNGTRAMVAMLYLRTSPTPNVPVTAISFGNARLNNSVVRYVQNTVGTNVTGFVIGAPPCNGPNIPNYLLNIPANALFNGAPGGIPNGLANGINIDLWEIQDLILNP